MKFTVWGNIMNNKLKYKYIEDGYDIICYL